MLLRSCGMRGRARTAEKPTQLGWVCKQGGLKEGDVGADALTVTYADCSPPPKAEGKNMGRSVPGRRSVTMAVFHPFWVPDQSKSDIRVTASYFGHYRLATHSDS